VTPAFFRAWAEGVLIEEGEEEVLGRDVLVLEGLRLAQRLLEGGVEVG
jgi:hypothetical protein